MSILYIRKKNKEKESNYFFFRAKKILTKKVLYTVHNFVYQVKFYNILFYFIANSQQKKSFLL